MIEGRPANTRRGRRTNGSVDPADWLSLAATPTFAIMAMLTGLASGPMDKLCGFGLASPLSGMALMYGLMSVFHSPPWLRLIRSLREGRKNQDNTHSGASQRGAIYERHPD